MRRGWIIAAVFAFSMWIAYKWDDIPAIKNTIHGILDPSLGILFNSSLWIGFIVITALFSLILMLAQKYLTDQETLKVLRDEQKAVQKEMKKYRNHPEKLMQLQKQQMEQLPKMMAYTMRPIIYTGIPVILLFRWFSDWLNPTLGGWWVLYYLVLAMIFSAIFKKIFKIA